MADLRSLVYVSQAVRPLSEADLGAILYAARQYNAHVGITGILVYERAESGKGGTFVQCIEGPPSTVQKTFDKRIRRASQHHHIVIKRDERIDHRRFPDWSMAYERSEREPPSGFDDLVNRLGPPPG